MSILLVFVLVGISSSLPGCTRALIVLGAHLFEGVEACRLDLRVRLAVFDVASAVRIAHSVERYRIAVELVVDENPRELSRLGGVVTQLDALVGEVRMNFEPFAKKAYRRSLSTRSKSTAP